jgi:hypothetical protein
VQPELWSLRRQFTGSICSGAALMPKGPQGQKRKRLWDIGDVMKLIEEWEQTDEAKAA